MWSNIIKGKSTACGVTSQIQGCKWLTDGCLAPMALPKTKTRSEDD